MADPVFIIPDNPLEKDADFGFSAYIDTISDLIANGRNKTPLVIGIYGKWGSGKTTLMRSIAHKLDHTRAYENPPFRRCKPVWFQAWKYKDEDEILAALLEQILNTMARHDFFSKFKQEIETFIQIPDSVAEFFRNRNLISVVKKFNPSMDELEQLKTLSAMVEPEASKKEAVPKSERDDNHRQVPIPAGEFLFGEEKKKTRIDYDYEMDIYPVTNQQFKRFIKADGYRDMAFWGKRGEKWQAEKQLQEPRYCNDKDYNDPEQPVVGISWFEAQAYANWLTTLKDDGFTYRLPTEEEWERAARGDDGNVYPWGDQFDPEKCNAKESGRGKPNRVNLYPNGISPYGCYDMSGNVWEWTSSFSDDNKDTYVIKGGAFGYSEEHCRCASRLNYNNPVLRSNGFGFRCARIKTLNS